MSSPLFDSLMEDIKVCMKNREADKLVALRSLHAQIKDVTVNAGKEVTDGDVAAVVGKAIKQRADAIEQYKVGNRMDLVEKEQKEVEAIKKYLPQQMERAEIEKCVRAVMTETGAAGKKDMGKVMQALLPQVKGRADGKLVSQIVQELLG